MDWNNDGKKDLLSGDTKGQVWLYLNTGTVTEPVLAAGVRVLSAGNPITGKPVALNDGSGKSISPQSLMGSYSKLHWGDVHGDGLEDLLVGQSYGTQNHIVVYRNVGTIDKPELAKPKTFTLAKLSKSRPSPYLGDLDGDGKPDMICGTDGKDILFYRNTGTVSKPKWPKAEKLKLKGPGFQNGYRHRLTVTDWNEDGKSDLLVGDYYQKNGSISGNLWLFLGK
ncbi:MAG: VCBS repeat-containing protein [Phycisphaeraceae bacterium]|nr:VCBS repeat-containing protein [Phycisphaeraceae bacterium]